MVRCTARSLRILHALGDGARQLLARADPALSARPRSRLVGAAYAEPDRADGVPRAVQLGRVPGAVVECLIRAATIRERITLPDGRGSEEMSSPVQPVHE